MKKTLSYYDGRFTGFCGISFFCGRSYRIKNRYDAEIEGIITAEPFVLKKRSKGTQMERFVLIYFRAVN
ncbi:hypothetical protein [Acetomicrobium sp.]|uniref:hypothetical protein n=1 Tax=Acetomicrobium sp. TaxID=1872099 RepID=UPI002FCA8D88